MREQSPSLEPSLAKSARQRLQPCQRRGHRRQRGGKAQAFPRGPARAAKPKPGALPAGGAPKRKQSLSLESRALSLASAGGAGRQRGSKAQALSPRSQSPRGRDFSPVSTGSTERQRGGKAQALNLRPRSPRGPQGRRSPSMEPGRRRGYRAPARKQSPNLEPPPAAPVRSVSNAAIDEKCLLCGGWDSKGGGIARGRPSTARSLTRARSTTLAKP